MTNVDYLKKHNLWEAHEHFMRLSEAYIPTAEAVIGEADDEEMGGDPNEMGADPNAMGGDPNAMGGDAMAGGDPNAMGADPNAMDPNMAGGDPNAMGGDPNAMGADPNAMDPNMAGGDPGMAPMDDAGMMGDDVPEEGDENTIDIAGLTRAEDKLNIKQNQIGRDLSKVDDRIMSLIDKIGNLQAALDTNNTELEALKAEFEKRNPTQTEKLNLRSLDSYPFNVRPDEYWKNKAEQGGYQAYSDNSEPTTKEYVITNNDVDNPSNDIADTFFKIDDDDIQTLDKLFNL